MSDALTNEKKKMLIDTLSKFSIGSSHALLREVLRRFFLVGRRSRAVRELNLMLLKTIGGRYSDSFNRWKTIPE
jgi:hypothetical protein